MKIGIGQKPLLFPLIILTAFGSISYAAYKNIDKLLDSARWLEHTEQVIAQSENILSLTEGLQTASLVFVTTNDPQYPKLLDSFGGKIYQSIGLIRSLTSDNPAQQQRIDSLIFYVKKRFFLAHEEIEVRTIRQGDTTAAYKAATLGSECTEHIRLSINVIREEEDRLLKQRKQANDLSVAGFNRFSVSTFILMLLFSIVLIIASGNYFLQSREKEKRAAELIIANKELAFQNDEKENRARELTVANTELAFQNEEKEKRAAELTIANAELAFQNREKEKRAAELIIVNKNLRKAKDDIRLLNEDLEQKVIDRTAQLESVNKELESFSYSVSHDLRAPIRAINGYALILEEDYAAKLDTEGTSTLNSIKYNSKKMGNLIDDLLAFSKLGRKQVTVSEINMKDLVEAVIGDLITENVESMAELNVTDLPSAHGDPSLIKQVWINLVTNAIKYSKYKLKPVIEIGAYEKDGFLVYYVKDNGVGFEMEYYDKLFGVFQRLHSQEEFEGTGIGLAIVQKIISRHRGMVWAESKPDEGACFYFSLPSIHS